MIEGSCHCGAVTWRFEGEPDGATACNCTVCRRYGVLWAYDFVDEGIKVAGPTPIVGGARSASTSAPSAAAWPIGAA